MITNNTYKGKGEILAYRDSDYAGDIQMIEIPRWQSKKIISGCHIYCRKIFLWELYNITKSFKIMIDNIASKTTLENGEINNKIFNKKYSGMRGNVRFYEFYQASISIKKNLEIEISKTNRGKEQIILNRKYKFNLSSKRKDNSKKYKCTEYKTLNRCPSFIILNNENQILEYDDSHNHLENKFGAAKSIVKNKIKDEISKSSIPFNVNIKRTYDEISQGMGLICPGYNSIKFQVTRSRRKQLPPDITTFDEIPNESKYYKTKRDENFMIFKNNDLIVFQSPFQAELFSKNKHIFADGTFYIAPIFSYQKLKKNSSKYNSIEITPKIFHCDFEKAVSNVAQKVFINANIKYCIWHFKRALEIKKKKNYVVINKIKSECQEHNYVQFLEFLEYFKKTYLINFETENWNYYDNIEHITNNVSETFNKYLKKLFAKKPTFFQLLSELQKKNQNISLITKGELLEF
ncbi:hypothetical protein H8356DRAFT_1431061 [Neocallimastix lanati (nom. inval.)]|nr:hypothetical protein H8356DRAFT_1431061 [Neocallimastix sp. JGI-2020a]